MLFGCMKVILAADLTSKSKALPIHTLLKELLLIAMVVSDLQNYAPICLFRVVLIGKENYDMFATFYDTAKHILAVATNTEFILQYKH